MRRLLLAVLVLGTWVTSASAGRMEKPACCACEPAGGGTALFCRRVPVDDLDALKADCDAQGGEVICKALPLGAATCTFEGLNCPAAPAPALHPGGLAALAVLLAGAGIVTVRRRARR